MNSGKIFSAVCFLLLTLTVSAAPSPWDSWRSGYTNFEQGEALRERGSYTEALSFFEKARKNYQAVRSARPDWNQRVIADRLRDCDRQISELKRLLGEGTVKSSPPSAVKPNVPQRVEKSSGSSATAHSPSESAGDDVVVVKAREISELRKEVVRLKAEKEQLGKEIQRQRNFETEVAALLRDRKIMEDKYALLDKRYKALEAERKRPDEKIISLEQRLVDEKMNSERLSKQIVALEQQSRIEKENSRMNLAARNALESLLQKRSEDLQNSGKEIERLTKRLEIIEQLNEKTSQLTREVAAGKQDLERKNDEIARLQRREKELEYTIEKERKIAAEKERKMAAEKEQYAKNVNMSETTVKADDSQLVELKQQITDLEKQLAAAGEQRRELEKQSNDMRRELEKQSNDMRRKLEQQCRELRKERDDAVIAARSEIQKNSNLSIEIRTLQLNLEQEKKSAKLTSAELANLRERNQELETDVKRLFDRNEDLEKRISLRNSSDFKAATEARNSVKKLEDDLLAAQNELIRLRSEADASKSALDNAERKLKAVNDENLKVRAEVVAAMEAEKKLHQELGKFKKLQEGYEQLQRNFNALAAENRENRLLAEAAKPRQAELERAKLRLVENDQLKAALAREQQLNAELQSAYNRDQKELKDLRQRAGEFDAARRKLIEFEALSNEIERYRALEKELITLREREIELAELKVKYSECENNLNKSQAELKAISLRMSQYAAQIADLRKENGELQKLSRSNSELRALINNQNSELDKLNRQLAAYIKDANKDLHISCRIEAEKLRAAAAEVGPLNDRIRKLQGDIQQLNSKISEKKNESELLKREIQLKNSEVAQLRKLNDELAKMRNNSAAELLNEVDEAREKRLQEELDALNKLNAELAAERDQLRSVVNNMGKSNAENKPSQPLVVSDRSPEELTASGYLAEKEGKTELAAWHYRQALAVKDDFVTANINLGMLLYRRGSFQEAAVYLEKAHQSLPDNLPLALDTARCLVHIGRFGNAKTIVDPLVQKMPDNAYIQMCAALIEAGCGTSARAEEKMLTAIRLAPESAEIHIELARLLASSLSNRDSEAVIAYEKARSLGHPPVPELEKKLGELLDQRRELVHFMSSAAREAEMNNDWRSAVWYYKKILEEKHPSFVPLLAFAQWKAGDSSSARETLEFNKTSRHTLVVRALIAIGEKDEENAVRTAQQCAGAVIPAEWVGVNLELEKLRKLKKPSSAVKVLLKSIKTIGRENRANNAQ